MVVFNFMVDGQKFHANIVDLTEFFQAGPDDQIPCYDEDDKTHFCRKGDVRDLSLDEV